MKTFRQHLIEAVTGRSPVPRYKSKLKWKNMKLINLKAYDPEAEYTSGKYTIIRVGTHLSYKKFLMIINGKVRPSGHGKGHQTYSKLEMAKFYFDELEKEK